MKYIDIELRNEQHKSNTHFSRGCRFLLKKMNENMQIGMSPVKNFALLGIDDMWVDSYQFNKQVGTNDYQRFCDSPFSSSATEFILSFLSPTGAILDRKLPDKCDARMRRIIYSWSWQVNHQSVEIRLNTQFYRKKQADHVDSGLNLIHI